MRLNQSLISTLLVIVTIPSCLAKIKCYDCVGMDCMGNFCEGDYCMISQYAPRWGTTSMGEPKIVKGCITGKMIDKDIRDHCEIAEDAKEPFTCFCRGNLCNSRKNLRKIEKEEVELIECVCNGDHCKRDKTCRGELCTYVYDHETKKYEQGCTNASVPLIERRAIGACMVPPITGAMHHTLAKNAQSLLRVESCLCGTPFCNSEKSKITVPEKAKCRAYVSQTAFESPSSSDNTTCEGEFCFTALIKAKFGTLQEYETYGCASFTGEDSLPEELNPDGCATFTSENLEVETCFRTKDREAIGRALATKEIPEREPPRRKSQKSKKPKQNKMEIEEFDEDDDEEEEEEEEEEKNEKKVAPKAKSVRKEKEKEEEKEEEEEEEENEENEEKEEKKEEVTTTKTFIFEKPTQPPIPDDSNTTMITVFVLLILCILGSGIVIKFELHKKLKRSSYDTVAGG